MEGNTLRFEHVCNPDRAFFEEYARIPMLVHVKSILKAEKVDRGLGGIHFREVPVDPYVKDLGRYESPIEFSRQFDIGNWAFFAAFDQGRAIAAATVASRTKEVNMLSGRDDLCLLWDIRVNDTYKHQGIGKRLLEMAVAWAMETGFSQMKIECQNNNLPAIRLYHKFGAVLGTYDEYLYYNEPDCREEAAMLWYIDLANG